MIYAPIETTGAQPDLPMQREQLGRGMRTLPKGTHMHVRILLNNKIDVTIYMLIYPVKPVMLLTEAIYAIIIFLTLSHGLFFFSIGFDGP